MSAGPIRDDDLHALVDGELEGARGAEVEAAVAQDPEAAAKVAFYRRLNRDLHRLYDAALAEPVPAPPARRRSWRAAAAILAALLVGAAGGWFAREASAPAPPPPVIAAPAPSPAPPPPGLVDLAAAAHRVYTAENRHAVEVAADDETHLSYWLSNRLGGPVKPPKLYGAGFKFMGGRLLPAAGGVAAQFMWEDKSGRRITLFVKKPDPSAPATFAYAAASDGVGVFSWTDDRFAYALAAAVPREELYPVAREVQAQVAK